MKKFKKLISGLGLMLSLSLVLTACGSTKEEPAATNVEESSTGKIGIVFTEAGLGGQSFNDLAFEGVKKAAEELGIEYDYVEPESVSDQEIIQDEMASSGDYDLIIAVGFEQVDAIKVVAANYPEQKFALLDATVDLPNVASYVSKEEEASFLLGAMSALIKESASLEMVKDSKTLGFIGGVESPLIEKFAAGYTSGAKYIDEEFNVLVDYVGGFSDPSTAKVISETMFSQGADIQYHASGASGMGMFQAAEEKGFVTIGVNSNQNNIAPDFIMASMLKLVDQAAYEVIQSVVNDEFNPGINTLGLAENGVGYTIEGSNLEVPEDIIETIEQLKEKIINGELEIPTTLADVDEFIENNNFEN